MIRVCDLSMPLDYTEKDLREAAAKALNIPLNEIKLFSGPAVHRRQKKGPSAFYLRRQPVSRRRGNGRSKKEQVQKGFLGAALSLQPAKCLSPRFKAHRNRDGPAGLFAGLILAQAGAGLF